MRAILIDPLARAVTEVQVHPEGGSTLASLYRIMGCHTVAVLPTGIGFDLWVDDEGRFVPNNGAFRCVIGRLVVHHDLVGPAVLLGVTPKGASAPLPAEITVERVTKTIVWLGKFEPPRMQVVSWSEFDGESCGGTWDGFTVGSDADPGL